MLTLEEQDMLVICRRTDRIIASILYGFGIGSGGMWLIMKTGLVHSSSLREVTLGSLSIAGVIALIGAVGIMVREAIAMFVISYNMERIRLGLSWLADSGLDKLALWPGYRIILIATVVAEATLALHWHSLVLLIGATVLAMILLVPTTDGKRISR